MADPETPNESTDTGGLEGALEKAWDESQAPAQEEPPAESPTPEPEKPEPDLKALEELDPDKLPQPLQDKLFKKFQPGLERRNQEFQEKQAKILEQQSRLLDNAMRAYQTANNVPAPPSIQEKLKEAVENNDLEAVARLTAQPIMERVERLEGEAERQNAYRFALSQDPDIEKLSPQIGKVLEANPTLVRMAAVPSQLPLVLQGISSMLKLQAAQAEIASLKQSQESAVKAAVEKAIAERRGRIEKMGSSLSSAGRVVSPREEKGPMTLEQSMEAAWADMEQARSGG